MATEHVTSREPERFRARQPRCLLAAWIHLLLVGALFLFASLSDLVADARTGLPSDHVEALHTVAGATWTSAKLSSPKITQYVTLLEVTYAVHELVFGLFFLLIVAIPLRRRARWAWWAGFVPMLANLTYTFTIGHDGTTTLVYSLIAAMKGPRMIRPEVSLERIQCDLRESRTIACTSSVLVRRDG